MNDTISVLSVDADEASQQALAAAVAAQALPYQLEFAASLSRARQLLATRAFDVVIVDSMLGDGSPLDVLADAGPYTVVIVTVGPGDEDLAARALRAGASDVVLKDAAGHYLARLPQRISAALRPRYTERLLRDSEQVYRALVEGTSDLIQSIGPDGRILFVNRAWRETLGYTAAEVAGLSVFDVIHPRSRAHCAALFPRIVVGEDVGDINLEFQASDGRAVAVEGRVAMHIENGQPVATRGIFRDVTERERARAAQRDLTTLLDEALRHTHMMMVLLDTRFTFIWVNAAYAATCRQDPSFFPGRNHFALYPHAENEAIFQRVVDTGEPFFVAAKPFEFSDQPERGVTYWDWSLVPTKDVAGTVRGLVFTLADVTDRVLADLEVQRLNDTLEHLVDERTRALAASEDEYRRLVTDLKDGIFVGNPQGIVTFANPAFARLMAFEDPQEVLGQRLPDLIASAMAKDVALGPMVGTGRKHDAMTGTIVRHDGTSAVVEVKSDVVMDLGTVVGIKGIMRDISERQLTEDALRLLSVDLAPLSGEAFFRSLSYQLADLLEVEIAFVGKLLPTDPHRIQTLGLCIDGVSQPSVEYDVAGTPCAGVAGEQATVFSHGVAEQFPGDRMLADLHITGYAAVPTLDAAGQSVGYVGIMSRRALHHADRVESVLRLFGVQVAAEFERQRGEDRFVSLFEFAPDALVIASERGVVTLVNQRAEELFGWPRAELVGQAMDRLIPHVFEDAHQDLRAQDPGTPSPREFRSHDLRAVRMDGSEVAVDVSVRPLEIDGRSHVVASIRDVTLRRRLESALSRARKMEMVGHLAGGIAHDFNNLLTVINGTSELAARSLPPSDPLRDDLTMIRDAGARAAALTKQLLAFSRRQILQPRVINLGTVTTQMHGMLERLIGDSIRVDVDLAPNLGNVTADPEQIEQVIIDLVMNARAAMPHGGTLTLELRNVDLDEAFGHKRGVAVPPGPYVMLCVTDTGTGMEEATLARIFDPFFTTNNLGESRGLGLATVFGFVKQSGGFIWVSSSVGRGTTMTLHLPRTFTGPEMAPPPEAAGAERGTETILIAEDQDNLRALATRILRSAGYTTLAAVNGQEAIRLLDNHDGPVDLLLTDVVMPGMSGPILAERLRASRPGLRVLYTSGHNEDTTLRHGVLAEGAHFIGKPYAGEALTRRVREVLDAPAPPARPDSLQ